MNKHAIGSALILCLSAYQGAFGQMTIQKTVISSESARKMGKSCETFAKQKGWHVSVWVIDEAGQSLYMYRMQGAPWLSVEPSRMKAQTALQIGRSSASYEDTA